MRPLHLYFLGVRALGALVIATGVTLGAVTVTSALPYPALARSGAILWLGALLDALLSLLIGLWLVAYAERFAMRWPTRRPLTMPQACVALAGIFLVLPEVSLLPGQTLALPMLLRFRDSEFADMVLQSSFWPALVLLMGALLFFGSGWITDWADPEWRAAWLLMRKARRYLREKELFGEDDPPSSSGTG